MKFKAYDVGLFYCDVTDSSSFYYGSEVPNQEMILPPDVPSKTKTTITNYSSSHVQTVSSNKSMYTVQEIEGADKAVALQQYIGWQGTTTYINYIKNNLKKISSQRGRCTTCT